MMLTLNGLGSAVGYTGSRSADNLREIPSWCSSVPFSFLFSSCDPYTQAELDRLTRSQAEYAANSPSSTIPVEERPAYIEAAVQSGNEVQAAAERSDPFGACVYRASQESPWGLQLLGQSAYCSPDGKQSGFSLNYLAIAAGGLLLFLLLRR